MIRYAVRSLLSITFFALLCGLAQGADKPADLIIGKWQGVVLIETKSVTKKGEKPTEQSFSQKLELEFTKDGVLTTTLGPVPELTLKTRTETVKYTFVKDNEIELLGKGKSEKVRVKVAIVMNELTLSFVEGNNPPLKFKRVKE